MVAREDPISNKEESGSESVLDCCVAVFEAVVEALEVVTDPALTFWYLEASLGPSSFHLPKTYFVRTKLSTLPSSGM